MKQKTTRTIHKCLSLLLAAAILLAMPGIPAQAETTGRQTGEQGAMPANPVHHCTGEDENVENDTTDWSYVYFGSYPQTEVAGAALTSAITRASYNANGDAWVDGTKYRRISKSDINYDEYFGDGMYRYFKWERIKWRVLQNDGSTLFVVADKGVDCKNYHETKAAMTWEDCTIRNWLNNSFYHTAFNSSERASIVEQTVVNEDNPQFHIEGGNDTRDKVYLLSIGEMLNSSYGFCDLYNVRSPGRRLKTSDYSHARGACINDYDYIGICSWWLRSPGAATNYAAQSYYNGRLDRSGVDVNCRDCAVVPALHINLSSDRWYMTDDGSSGEGGEDRVIGEPGSTMTDYETDVSSFMKNKGTLSSLKYLCTDSNFTNSIYVHENDEAFAGNVPMELSDVYYRGMDGWKELFRADTSREYAEKILAALLQNCQSDAEHLAMEKNAEKYAEYFVSGLNDYVKSDAVISSVANQDIEKLLSIITEQKVEELLMDGKYGSLSKEFQNIGGYAQDSEVVKMLEDYMSSKTLANILSRGLGFIGDGLTIFTVTQDTFYELYQLESLMDAGQMYMEMLLFLKSYCCYDVVKDAAGKLYNAIYAAYMEQVESVTTALGGLVTAEDFDLVVGKAAEGLYYHALISAEYDGVDLSESVFSAGGVQKVKDNMRVIAYVGQCLSQWTLDSRGNFLGSTVAAEKNMYARRLYYSMYMLWHARKAAEASLQNMFTESNGTWSKYYTQSLQISSTLDALKNCMFTDSMTEALVSVAVSCPVDVEVYDAEGRLLVTAKDGEERSECVRDVYSYVKYQKVDDDYVKILCIPDNSGYTIKSIGRNLGTVDTVITGITEEGLTDRRYFQNVTVDNDTVITVNSVSAVSDRYTITNPSTGETKEGIFQSEPEVFVPSAEVMLSEHKMELKAGESRLLIATISPDNATEKKVLWSSSDESVVTVNSEGVVKAVGVGNAAIRCTALDNMENRVSCEVTVSSDAECVHSKTEVRGRIAATCGTKGYTGDAYCKDCNAKLESGQVVAATGRHTWNAGEEIKSSTCTEKGEKEYACTVCGEVKKERLQKIPHTYQNTITQATTAQNGSITEKCTVCGEVKRMKVIYAVKTAALKTSSYIYNGKAKKPQIIVRDSSGNVVNRQDYEVAYRDNKNIGKAAVTIKLKGNYTGTITKSFKILPGGTSISGKIAGKPKSFLVKWKKQKNISGYQVQYSTNRNFKGKTAVTKTVKRKSSIKLAVRKLKPKKKYYVRVRTYKAVKGKNYYSAWSNSKSVATKK